MKPEKSVPRTTWVKHHKRRNYAVIAFVTGILILIIFSLSGTTPPTGAQIGQQAPDFTVQDISNTSFHLFDHKGKPIMIEFMATGCHYCTEQAPVLSSLWSKHSNHVDFISISIDLVNDQPSVLSAYAQSHNMPWTWARDEKGLKGTYGVTGTPTMFLLDDNCVIKYRFAGFTDLQTLENGVQALL